MNCERKYNRENCQIEILCRLCVNAVWQLHGVDREYPIDHKTNPIIGTARAIKYTGRTQNICGSRINSDSSRSQSLIVKAKPQSQSIKLKCSRATPYVSPVLRTRGKSTTWNQ